MTPKREVRFAAAVNRHRLLGGAVREWDGPAVLPPRTAQRVSEGTKGWHRWNWWARTGWRPEVQ